MNLEINELEEQDGFPCKYCAVPIRFIQDNRFTGSKRFRPVNLDGSNHFKTCDRAHLFGRSIVHCKGCGCNLEREAGEWQAGNYYDASNNCWTNGRWFPKPSFRVISCPTCGWFYNWDADRDGFEFPQVEMILLKLGFDGWIKLKYGVIRIVRKARKKLPIP